MKIFNCIDGQSFSDVCLNTYGTLDDYVKMLNDSNILPNDIPITAQPVVWDETLVQDQSVLQLTNGNGIIYSTLYGYVFSSAKPIPAAHTVYYDPSTISYTATQELESTISLSQLSTQRTNTGTGGTVLNTGTTGIGNLASVQIISLEIEAVSLKATDFTHDAATGTITFNNGISMAQGETMNIMYQKLAGQ